MRHISATGDETGEYVSFTPSRNLGTEYVSKSVGPCILLYEERQKTYLDTTRARSQLSIYVPGQPISRWSKENRQRVQPDEQRPDEPQERPVRRLDGMRAYARKRQPESIEESSKQQ